MIIPKQSVRNMRPYSPPTQGRGGKVRLDFNENTVGCSPRVLAAVTQALTDENVAMYPEYSEARAEIANFLGVDDDQLTFTNGTDEAIQLLVNTFFESGDELVIISPSYAMYRFYAEVAGVQVTQSSGEPGAAASIRIRGNSSIRSGNGPLIVVDGVPLDGGDVSPGNDIGLGSQSARNPLNFINPADIETMDVLKDASATAIYGARGANGVILITTKKGKSGTSVMNYSSSVGVSELTRALPVYSAAEFRKKVVEVGGLLDDKGGNTDWQKEITRTALTQNHNLTMSGGAEKLTYFASFGLQNQEGIIKTNDLKRYSGRFNATQKFLNDRLIVDVNLSANNTKQQRPNIGGVIGDALSNNPTYSPYDAQGNIAAYQLFNNPLLTFKLD